MRKLRQGGLTFALAIFASWLHAAAPENSLVWNREKDRVDADVRTLELTPLLERITAATGWQVLVEPGTTHTASAKFKNLPSGEALRLLLANLNFALVPQTNASPRLYVFRTAMHNATQLVRVEPAKPKYVPNELIVRVKPGTDIEQLARLLGAKVVGRIRELNAYRLQFDDAGATDSARDQLAQNPEVTDVGYNYYFEEPQPSRGLLASSMGPLSLQLKPPADSGRIIVGLIDTGVQTLGPELDKFFLKAVSVAGDSRLDPTSPSHGTAMAETILRSLEMVTKGSTSAQILPVDVYGPSPTANTWSVAEGIVAAVNRGANVLNLSLGGTGDSSILRDVVKAVNAKGIPIFAAAGNEPVATPFFPAAYPEVVAVTAVEKGKIANYANFGSFVDVAAPDASVVHYNNQPWFVRGTSASAAFTTGMAAGLADTSHKGWSEVQATILRTFAVPASGK